MGYGCQRSSGTRGRTVGLTQLMGQRPRSTRATSRAARRRVSGRMRVPQPDSLLHKGHKLNKQGG